jgi:hypothetical protein
MAYEFGGARRERQRQIWNEVAVKLLREEGLSEVHTENVKR